MAWHRLGDRPCSETMMGLFTNAYISQLGLSGSTPAELVSPMIMLCVSHHLTDFWIILSKKKQDKNSHHFVHGYFRTMIPTPGNHTSACKYTNILRMCIVTVSAFPVWFYADHTTLLCCREHDRLFQISFFEISLVGRAPGGDVSDPWFQEKSYSIHIITMRVGIIYLRTS